MTLAPPEKSGSPDPDAVQPDAAQPDESAVVRPVVRQRAAKQRKKKRRTLVVVQGVLTAVFVIALVTLGYAGWQTALRITGGSSSEVTDPDAPGYTAAVKPTGVTLIAFTGPDVPTPTTAAPDNSDGAPDAESSVTPDTEATVPSLAAMVLVIERSGDGRTLVPIPAFTTLWDFEDAGPDSAANIFASGGIDALRLRLGADLSFGTTAAVTAPVSVLGDLASAVGPVTISLPDDVLAGTSTDDATVRYPAGQLTLQPEEIAEFMSYYGLAESESNRALRQQLVWEALVNTATDAGTEVSLPAEGDGEAAATLISDAVAADTRFDLVPMLAVPLNVSPPTTLYRIDQMAMPTWVASEVPFPISAFPGQRARVALLNGTTDDAATAAIAPTVVGANGEISVTGNAESFDVAVSTVEYGRADAAAAAEQIAAALGLTATLEPDSADADVDVVVVVGADRLSQG